MRLWSLHPTYLDSTGLIALWREGLLAQKVLAGKTRGYTRHPQLERFRAVENSIGNYLDLVWIEADKRGYKFDRNKILAKTDETLSIEITDKQLEYEFEHLMSKLHLRSPKNVIEKPQTILPHPIFNTIQGEICSWERKRQSMHNQVFSLVLPRETQ